MSEKKYVLTRRADADPTRTSFLYEMIPGPGGGDDLPVHVEEVDFYRAHLDVDDRTQPDWSHVPTGTAGTATVRGVEGVRVIRSDVFGWLSGSKVNHFTVHPDEEVADFKPDVVVDKALFGAVGDAIINTSLTETDKRIAIAAAHRALRGES